MADKENKFRTVNIFWSKEDSDGADDELIGARGNMAAAGNRRPKRKNNLVKGKKTVEVKANIPSTKKQPLVQTLPSAAESQTKVKEGEKNASLKDLCLEDKQRIANLIKELARLGEEKEMTIQAFEQERSQFEEQVRELVTQQDHILHERESIQSQLHECQDLLVKYQRLVNEQKHKLTESLLETKELSQERFDAISQRQHNCQAEELAKPATMLQQGHDTVPPLAERLTSRAQSDTADGGRPFTSMIDLLIAEERNRSKTTDDRELKLGPLANPQFESTHVNSTVDFQPLMPDRTTPLTSDANSNHDESSSVTTTHFAGPELVRPKSESTPSKKATSALIPEGLSDSEFMDYYKKLTPADRKKQLFVQKQALLEEQERLKKVLDQQEALLEKKHVELRRQQEIQRERLNYFERTGSFPNHFMYRPDTGPDSFSAPNASHVSASALGYPHGSDGTYQRQTFMPVAPPPPHPLAGYYGHVAPPAPPPAYPLYGVPPHYAPPMAHAHPGYPRVPHPGQQVRYGEEDGASDCTKETRSTSTSPMPGEVDTNPASIHGHVVRHSTGRAHRPAARASCGPHTTKPTLADLRDDRAAHLLDIVDEVESLHNRSMESAPTEALSPYLVPSRKQRPLLPQSQRHSIPFSELSSDTNSDGQIDGAYEDGDISTESLEDLEESRVLEDVFFIK